MELTKQLGSLIARMDGSGIYSQKLTTAIPMTLVCKIGTEDGDIEFGPDGEIEFVWCKFSAHFGKPATVYCDGGHPYTDKGIEKAINNFLAGLGYKGFVEWSELGRQYDQTGDFDASYGLIEELFPDYIAEQRKKHRQAAA